MGIDSFDNNVNDMAAVVTRLADAMDGADSYLSPALYTAMENVLSKWRGHLHSDCEDVSRLLPDVEDCKQEVKQSLSLIAEYEEIIQAYAIEVEVYLEDITLLKDRLGIKE